MKQYGGQLISGIKYIHSHCIVHQDLKPLNVLLSEDKGTLKIIDFGVSQKLDQANHVMQSEIAGTYRYMALELHKGSVCLKSDIWAFGCILLELATGRAVFDGLNELGLCYKIVKGTTPLDHAKSNGAFKTSLLATNPELLELVERCLDFDYQKRPSSTDIFSHPFFQGYTTVVEAEPAQATVVNRNELPVI